MTVLRVAQYWLDGLPLPEGRLSLEAESPVLLAGAGWFETIRIEGGLPLHYELHLQRLCTAAISAGVGVSLRESLDTLLVPALVAARDHDHARLRITLMPRPIFDNPPQVLVSLAPFAPPVTAYTRGLSVVTTCLAHPGLGRLGKSLSYHWSLAARREAQARGADEALFANHEGWLEASTASLLWREAGGLCSTSGCAGTLASVTVEALRRSGLAIEAREVAKRHDIIHGGLLLVSALRLVVAVREIDGQPLPDLTATASELRERLLTAHQSDGAQADCAQAMV